MKRFLTGWWENVELAVQALRVNKMRTILTTLGIIIGVLTVVSVASIIEGLNRGFASQIAGLGSNTLYISKYPWVIMDDFFKYRNRPNITLANVQYVVAHARVADAISPMTSTRQSIRYRDNSLADVVISGVTLASAEIENIQLADGRYFTALEIDHKHNKALIGYEIADKLFGQRNPFGERIRIGSASYTIIGTLPKRGNILGHNQDMEVYVPFASILKNFGIHRSLSIAIKVNDVSRLEAARDEARILMRIARGLKPHEEDNFSINQQEALTQLYRQLTQGLYTAAFGISLLSLIVGGIGIMNIMLVSVTERRKEIGIRKALGARRSLITAQFIIESIVICGTGGLIAVGISFLMSLVIDKITPFPSTVPVWSVIMGLGFAAAVGLFFGIYPARRAARLDPIECLRYE